MATGTRAVTTLALLLGGLAAASATDALAQGRGFGPPPGAQARPRGLVLNTPAAAPGYTLFAPLNGTTTYLIDLDGQVVNSWESDFTPSAWVYLLDDGHLLRGGREPLTSGFSGGGQGGRFQKFTFDGELVWDYSLNTELRLPHHDVAVLPNGNILAIVWEAKDFATTQAAGRREGFIPDDGIWGDVLVELEPIGSDGARIVWEWHTWDHLVQDTDPALANFGKPSDLPARIDINGDIVGQTVPPAAPTHDVFHLNAVAYNAALDQIVVSVPTYNEIWIIDHSTTTEEAASSTGGRYGRGGDLLYRWGNPQAYGRGTAEDRQLGFQHDSRWIPSGYPGGDNILVFSNRTPAPGGRSITTVMELQPPIDRDGQYPLADGDAYGPALPVWTYADPPALNAQFISGAERLPNGNTLITAGPQGRMFEVDRDGDVVWDYWSPYGPDPDVVGASPQSPFSVFRAIRIAPDHPGLPERLR